MQEKEYDSMIIPHYGLYTYLSSPPVIKFSRYAPFLASESLPLQ